MIDKFTAQEILRAATGGSYPSRGEILVFNDDWRFRQLTTAEIPDNVVLDDDPRLSDTRTPVAHAPSHHVGGADELDLDSITGSLNALKLYGEVNLDGGQIGGAVFSAAMLDLSAMGSTPLVIPFGAGLITNLNSHKLGGYQVNELGRLALSNIWDLTQIFTSAASFQSPTVPFVVVGDDRVDNLNAQYWDGLGRGTSGQVVLGITGSAPAYGQISNSHIVAGAGIAWSKLDLSTSNLANLATRSAGDLSSGNLPYARLPNAGSGGTWAAANQSMKFEGTFDCHQVNAASTLQVTVDGTIGGASFTSLVALRDGTAVGGRFDCNFGAAAANRVFAIRAQTDRDGTKLPVVFSCFDTGTNNTEFMRGLSGSGAGGVALGASVALATNATAGFVYLPTCAGAPTGVPVGVTGKAPCVVDSTNKKIYLYLGGAWVSTAALT